MMCKNYNDFLNRVKEYIGENRVSEKPDILQKYSHDTSFLEGFQPKLIIWPNDSSEVQKIVRWAYEASIPLIPVSSGDGLRQNGDIIPRVPECVIIDLSKINKIIRIDRINRVVMIEPGVTFAQLIPELKKHDLRPLMPLIPRSNKSVVASMLEREPQLIPRYHWDTLDPLLCVEVYFGTGDMFRTGSAAGPGNLEEQIEVGQAQKNPMGPTQFSIVRTIQGAMGSIGIVTWATMKCEIQPTIQKLFFIQAEKLSMIIDFIYEILKFRFSDELFLINKPAFACLIEDDKNKISQIIKSSLKEWVAVFTISGKGTFAEDRVNYLKEDIKDIARKFSIKFNDFNELKLGLSEQDMINLFQSTSDTPWYFRYKGRCERIFFITTLDRTSEFVELIKDIITKNYSNISNFGFYIQPQVQGCNCHFEVQFYYNPDNTNEVDEIKQLTKILPPMLMDAGAFFSRPYGHWADEMFSRISEEGVIFLQKVKNIFDPKNILNPGVLCFSKEIKNREN